MNEILKLADSALDLWAIGKEIVDLEVEHVKKITTAKASSMISSTMSLLIFVLTFLIMLVIGFIGLGAWTATYFEMPYLTYITPMLLCAILMIISWTKRKSLFKRLTKEIIEESLSE